MSIATSAAANGKSYVTEASAGTGKTTDLVNSIIGVLRTGSSVEKIVAVTFTHAAAGEMKLRLRQRLEYVCNEEVNDEIKKRLASALEHLEEAFVGTIHAFCARLLRQRPVEAGIDPAFRELSQMEASQIFAAVFREWLVDRLPNNSSTLNRAFARLAWREDRNENPSSHLRSTAWKLAQWRDLSRSWSHHPFDRQEKIDQLLDRLVKIVAGWREKVDTLDYVSKELRPSIDLAERVEAQRATECADYDLWEVELESLLRWKPAPRHFGFIGGQGEREPFVKEFGSFAKDLRGFGEQANADFAVNLRDELWTVVERYQATKARAGQLDFTDLLLSAKALMKNDDARSWFQERYQHLFVDEFQDTDPLQAEVLLLLASADPGQRNWRSVIPVPGKLFLVGDPKQSIYRFRRADVVLYRSITHQLLDPNTERRELKTNYRSNMDIEGFVNASFAGRIPAYLAIEGGRTPLANQCSVLALPIPEIYGKQNEITKEAIETCAPKTTGAFVSWLLYKSGWLVTRNDGKTEKIRPSDICILFRRFRASITRGYVRSLESHEIPHVLIGSKSLHDREEVMVLRAALNAIEWPEDELCVFAVIKGPLFAVSDSILFKFKCMYGPLHPFKPLPENLGNEFDPVRQALHLLAELHRKRNYRSIASTIDHLLRETRAHAAFAFRPGGERVLANVNRLIDLARRFESTTATSFRSFIEYLDAEAEEGEATEAPLLENDVDGVKLMTVHKAKGLEFPVVVLADPTCPLCDETDGSRYVNYDIGLCAQQLMYCAPWELIEHRQEELQAEREEADRLAYVAATRARDILVVCSIGVHESDGWLAPLNQALYPAQGSWRQPLPTVGCSFDGTKTAWNIRDSSVENRSIKPGLYSPQVGSHRVLWFDPGCLALDRSIDCGVKDEDLLAGDPALGLAKYKEWQQGRNRLIEVGAAPTHRVTVATASSPKEKQETATEIVSISVGSPLATGRRFGTLLHQILRDVDWDPEPEALAMFVRTQGTLIGANEAEISSSIAAVEAILQHPLIREAALAAKSYREFPILIKEYDGAIIEGSIDLLYEVGERWTIIDFKTGLADRVEYKRQIALYGKALKDQNFRAILFEIVA